MKATIRVAVLATLVGCTFGRETEGVSESSFAGNAGFAPAGPATEYNLLDLDEATLDGRVGQISGLAGRAIVTEAYGGENWLSMRLDSTGSNGAAMNVIDVQNIRITAGLHLRSTLEDQYSPTPVPHIGVMGCSGPEVGNWEFDTMADEVILDVEPLGDHLVLNYQATFYDGSTVQGSATVAQSSLDLI